MNVIAMANGREYANRGIMGALCRLEVGELFLIDNEENPRQEFPSLCEKCAQRYVNEELHAIDYSATLEGDNQIPIEPSLLAAFAPYLLTAVKMLERTQEENIPFDERVHIVFTHLKYWNTIITRHDIGLYLGLDVPHGGYNYIIYALCKIHGIKTVFMQNCPVMGYSYPMNSIEENYPQIVGVYQKLTREYEGVATEKIELSKDFAAEYDRQAGADDKKVPYYMKDGSIKDHYGLAATRQGGVKKAYKAFRHIASYALHPSMRGEIALNSDIQHNTRRYYEIWDSLVKPIDMVGERYIYFPLHLQPECTTTPQGGEFTWQILAVEILSRCLPDDVYIYVKENPKQGIKARSLHYPMDLARIPHVKLVRHDTDTYSLIENSIAVATITGTALWEGLWKGKNGIMFGSFITQYAPGIFKVENLKECQLAVDRILQGGCAPTHRELKIFLKAMEQVTSFCFISRAPLEKKYSMEQSAKGVENCLLRGVKDSGIEVKEELSQKEERETTV